MLFTGKGDQGQTGLFGSKQKVSKSSAIAEALGSLDEVNSFLGFAKIKSKEAAFKLSESGREFSEIVHGIQETLFIIQAEMAGAQKTVEEKKLRELEEMINAIEKELPPITSFFISGGVELASLFDFARTLARRAERRVVFVQESIAENTTPEGEMRGKIGEWSRAYLNRLSSILYALARLSNHKSGIKEQAPSYR